MYTNVSCIFGCFSSFVLDVFDAVLKNIVIIFYILNVNFIVVLLWVSFQNNKEDRKNNLINFPTVHGHKDRMFYFSVPEMH